MGDKESRDDAMSRQVALWPAMVAGWGCDSELQMQTCADV